MDALPRRPLALLAAALTATGCHATGDAPLAAPAVTRSQAPVEPIRPAGPLPAPPAAVLPSTLPPGQRPAPVVGVGDRDPAALPSTASPLRLPSQIPQLAGPAAEPAPPPSSIIPVSAVTQTALTVAPDSADTQVRVVAVVGTDAVITDDEVWQMVRQRADQYIKLTGAEREAKEKELFRESLRALIDRELILSDFLGKIKKNKPQLLDELDAQGKKSAAKQIRQFKSLNKFASDEEFAKALRGQGMSLKGMQRQLERQAIRDIYLGELFKETKDKVTLAQVQLYYAAHPDDFRVDEAVEWQHLFVAAGRFNGPDDARRYADHLRQQAAGGADFAAIVTQYGHGDAQLRKGAGIGTRRGDIRPAELEPVVFALKAGQVSDLVPTDTGFHVVKVVSVRAAGLKPLDEKVQTEIRMKLAKQVSDEVYQKTIEDLWRKTTVRIVELP